MADNNKPLGTLLRQHIRNHKAIGPLCVITDVELGDVLEKLGGGIARKLAAELKDEKKSTAAEQADALAPMLATYIGDKLVDKVLTPQLRGANAKESVQRLRDISAALAALSEDELDAICKNEIKEAVKEHKKKAAAAAAVAAPPPRARPQRSSSSSSSGGWGGK